MMLDLVAPLLKMVVPDPMALHGIESDHKMVVVVVDQDHRALVHIGMKLEEEVIETTFELM